MLHRCRGLGETYMLHRCRGLGETYMFHRCRGLGETYMFHRCRGLGKLICCTVAEAWGDLRVDVDFETVVERNDPGVVDAPMDLGFAICVPRIVQLLLLVPFTVEMVDFNSHVSLRVHIEALTKNQEIISD